MRTICFGGEPELRITVCRCDGEGKGYWRDGQEYKVSIFVPQWFLDEFGKFPSEVGKKFRVAGEALGYNFGSGVHGRREREFRNCSDCSHAPDNTRYVVISVYSEEEEKEEVDKALSVLREAYNYYLSRIIKIYEQRTYILTIAYEPKDRVEVLKQIIEGENEA